jgi:hypothetical protein
MGLLMASHLMAAQGPNGVFDEEQCVKDATGSPGLPKTVCYFPTCPGPQDCLAPEIDRPSAKLDFLPPAQRWYSTCPDKQISGSCWEATLDFKFALAATDPSGVAEIGLTLSIDQMQKKSVSKFMMKADTRDSKNRYTAGGGMILYVPAGKRVDLVVMELCAKDLKDNEGCVPPANLVGLNFRPH